MASTPTTKAKPRRTKSAKKPDRKIAADWQSGEWRSSQEISEALAQEGLSIPDTEIDDWPVADGEEVVDWLITLSKGPGHHARLPEVLVGKLPSGWKRPQASPAPAKPESAEKRKEPKSDEESRTELPISDLIPSPTNPRKTFAKEAIDSLAKSFKNVGVLQSLLVRPHADERGKYEIIAGERRYRAAKQAGLKMVPVEIRDLTDEEVLEAQLIENLERQDLNAIEEAIAFQQLVDTSIYSERTLAKRLKLSQGHISNRIRLLKLPEAWQQKVISGEITVTEGRDLARWAERPQVLDWLEKDLKKGHIYSDFTWQIRRAVEDCSRPLTGGYTDRTNGYRWVEVALTKKDREREDLDIEEVKDLGQRAFNLKLWEELQAAGEERRAKRQSGNGKTDEPLSPTEAKRKVQQKQQQHKTRLYRYKVRWLQREIAAAMDDLDYADLTNEALMLRCGLLLVSCWGVPHEPLIDEAKNAGGKGGSLHGKAAWDLLHSIPDDRVMPVLCGFIQTVVQLDVETSRNPIRAAHIEGIARDLKIDIAEGWVLEEEYLQLQTKDQLESLAKEWGVCIPAGKKSKSEIIAHLLEEHADVNCPKELASLKPQFS